MPISSHELVKFPNRVFVETGSYIGDGIASALIAGFEEVYSVDISQSQYDYVCKRFEGDKRVHLFLDDSGNWLDKILNQINEPCTIYLDANGWRPQTDHPFDGEIRALKRHGKKHHTILVDDMNGLGSPREEVEKSFISSKNHIANSLLTINKDYQLSLIDSHTEDFKVTYIAFVAVAKPIV